MPNRDLREVADALSGTSRTERKWLLVSSFAVIALSWGGLVPTKISAFGVEIGPTRATLLVGLVLAICVYFLVTFVFHYRTDRFATEDFLQQHEQEIADGFFAELRSRMDGIEEGGKTHQAARKAFKHTFERFFRTRYAFDFWSAVVISIASLLAGAGWIVIQLTK